MDRMEQRVRDSLRARAAEVEPSTELWDEVGERIARRQRWRVTAWAVAGATAVAVGVLVVPGLLGGGLIPPEIDPVSPTEDGAVEEPEEGAGEEPIDDPVEEPTEEPGEADPEPGPGEDDGTIDATGVVEPVVAVHDNELVLLSPDGATTLVTLPEEGHSTFLSVAVRPGSTVDDLTIVTTTEAEGFQDIRWTRVIDGEVVVAFEPFEGQHPPAASTDVSAWVSPIVWSPDGGSVAWIDHAADGSMTLRTVGWDDGPGTGRDADDNASFGIEGPAPSGMVLDDWVSISLDETRSLIRATMADSNEGWYGIPMERQADGALAAGTSQVFGVDDPALGPVGAVGGDTGDGEPRWIVRLGFDGALVTDLVTGTQTDLPADLLPGDGFADLWLRPHADGAIVGSRNTQTSYLLVDGALTPIEVPTTDLAPIG